MQPLIALARLELTPTYKQAETFIKEAWYRLRAVDAGPRDDKPSQEVLLGLCNTFSGAAETLLQADALKYEQPQDRLVEQLEILQVAYKGLQEIAARYNQDWEQALWWAERGRAQALQDQLVRLMHKRNASSGLSQPGGIAQGDSGSKGHASAVSPAGSLAPKSMVQKLPAGVLVVVLTALNANTLGSPLIASTTHIVFLPDQVLARVPFTALHDGVQYLVQRTGVSVSPSLAMLYECLGNSAQAEVCGRWLMISQVDSKAKEERKLVKEVIQTVGAEEGWEVIAQFPDKLATVKPLVEAAVIEHLGSLTAVRLEWGVACTVAYMTFLHAASVDSVNLLISRLARDGVKMAFNKKSDKESEILILDTGSWTWLKLEKPPCIRWVVLITTPAAGYLKKFIVAKGVNLFHRNLVLRYRLHPDPSSHSPVVAFDLVHPDELRELNIQALVAEVDTVDTVAMRAPPEMDSTDVTHLIMEFWQGLRAIGARIKLPLDEYRKQAREQGDSDAEGPATPQRFMLLDVQSDSSGSGSSFPEPQFGEVQALQQSDTLQQTNSRSFQKRRWDWDVFICHAGEDKPFGRLLWDRLVLHDLRAFLDDESLVLGTQVDQSLERAAKSTQIAVVLLSREFFQKEWPRKELGWFLSHAEATRAQVIPVFLRITADECAQLAGDDALAAVCNIGGIRHAGEQYLNMPVYEQRTIEQIVEEICCRTGVAYRGCD
ncbi:hypothetical protein WJX72_008866 [[Myrmecia] bisecta]|uniref:TIR domain-containing protein n=1 Tax=[Myrmecia] bisecta TaxID=41462 RepID=A0AAW1Q8C1_9CHLO